MECSSSRLVAVMSRCCRHPTPHPPQPHAAERGGGRVRGHAQGGTAHAPDGVLLAQPQRRSHPLPPVVPAPPCGSACASALGERRRVEHARTLWRRVGVCSCGEDTRSTGACTITPLYHPQDTNPTAVACATSKAKPRRQQELSLEMAVGWASPSSRGLWGGDALLLSTPEARTGRMVSVLPPPARWCAARRCRTVCAAQPPRPRRTAVDLLKTAAAARAAAAAAAAFTQYASRCMYVVQRVRAAGTQASSNAEVVRPVAVTAGRGCVRMMMRCEEPARWWRR